MECPISLYYTNKFYEVQDYLTLTGHVYGAAILLANNDFYNSLPEDLRELVMDASIEFRDAQRELAQQQDREFLEQLKAEGINGKIKGIPCFFEKKHVILMCRIH